MNQIKLVLKNKKIFIKNENEESDLLDFFNLKINSNSKNSIQEQICFSLSKLFPFMPQYDSEISIDQSSNEFNNSFNKFSQSETKIEEIVLYPGTFNPLHKGHYECVSQLKNKNVLIIPDKNPWKENEFKDPLKEIINIVNAFENTSASIYPSFKVLSGGNPTISWIKKVKVKRKFLLIGDDSFLNFHKWKQYQDILQELYGLYVIPREGHKVKIEQQVANFKKINSTLEINLMAHHKFENLSSSKIRNISK